MYVTVSISEIKYLSSSLLLDSSLTHLRIVSGFE